MNRGSSNCSKLGKLGTKFGSIFKNFRAIDNYYEIVTNYPWLIINLELIIKKYFIILFQRISLNSDYRIEIILLLNLVKFLRISKVQTKFEFEMIWFE
jgi:hypothetical protein